MKICKLCNKQINNKQTYCAEHAHIKILEYKKRYRIKKKIENRKLMTCQICGTSLANNKCKKYCKEYLYSIYRYA